MGLQLTEYDVVQPDLVVVLKNNEHMITNPNVPDLVVEILLRVRPADIW